MSDWGTPFKIHEAKSWPPGSLMCYHVKGDTPETKWHKFFAVGMVISNDGKNKITVIWSPHCREKITTYDVIHLNPQVISRLR